jgi:hypothetical protein
MHPLKVVIPGAYWDSHIYQGKLYLFGRNKSLRVVDWDSLVDDLKIGSGLRLAAACGLKQSDYLYGPQWNLIFADRDVRRVIVRKFEALSRRPREVAQRLVGIHTLAEADNPFPFPHADAIIYMKTLFVAAREGLWSAPCARGKKTGRVLDAKAERLCEQPLFGLAASYGAVTLAAGPEGLLEMSLQLTDHYSVHDGNAPEVTSLSKGHCSSCQWTFYSVYASSHVGGGFMAGFTLEKQEHEDQGFGTRAFDRLISDEEIFGSRGFSWGTQDKICQVAPRGIRVVSYQPWNENGRFENLGEIELPEINGQVVSAGIAAFGTVIELPGSLVIVQSDGEVVRIPEEPVNWRTFPRSIQYENHLHIIYEDRIEVLSFNHDYFVDQKAKTSGTRFFASKGRRRYTPR